MGSKASSSTTSMLRSTQNSVAHVPRRPSHSYVLHASSVLSSKNSSTEPSPLRSLCIQIAGVTVTNEPYFASCTFPRSPALSRSFQLSSINAKILQVLLLHHAVKVRARRLLMRPEETLPLMLLTDHLQSSRRHRNALTHICQIVLAFEAQRRSCLQFPPKKWLKLLV